MKGAHTNVKVTVTDQYIPSAEDSYGVNWHPPYEKTGDVKDFPYSTWVATDPLSQTVTGDITVPLGVSLPSGTKPVSYFVDGLAAVGGDWIKDLIKAVDGGFNDPYSYNALNGTVNPHDAWARGKFLDTDFGTPSGHSRVPLDLFNVTDGYVQCTFLYQLVTYTTESKWYADKYNQSGFDSPNHILGAKRTTLVQAEPFFTRQLPPN